MPNPSAAFGPTLRSLRHELRLSQEALAEAVGSTQRHLSFLETGRSAPTRAMLGRIVAALRLTAAQ
ncbi:MAG: helix-turn-helix transcriptional regulator, partial [Myxococcota bacterium]